MFNFTVQLDKNSEKPLYEQLYSHIANEIRLKNLKENERMPSKKALSSHLGISVNTVETAYSILVQEGYLQSIPRSGYYVCRVDEPIGHNISYSKKEPKKNTYRIDFKTNAVDFHAFPFATWSKLSKEIMYSSPELLNSGDPQGDYILRESITKYLHEFRGVQCEPEQIIVGAGIEYLLMLLTKILDKNSVYAIENPGYRKTYEIIKDSEKKINYINVDNDGMITSDLTKTDSNIVYITPSHQFPTGSIMPIGRRFELISWASKSDNRYIIEDDYNSEFNFSAKPIPAVQGLLSSGKVIYMSTFSRTLAPSIRIAYMVLPWKLLEIYHKEFFVYSSTVSRFEQHTLSKFISEGYLQRHLNRIKNIYKKRRDMIISELKKLPYPVKIYGEHSGLHLLVQVNDADKILNAALKRGIRIYSLDDYFFTPVKEKHNTLIIGYASCTEDDIKELIKIMSEAL
jgi:GntR family transcriptional regulator/MocR family aminotransferase